MKLRDLYEVIPLHTMVQLEHNEDGRVLLYEDQGSAKVLPYLDWNLINLHVRDQLGNLIAVINPPDES